MLTLIVRLVLWLLPVLFDGADWLLALPGDELEVDFDTDVIERYAFVLYPVLALGTIALVVVAIVSTVRSDEIVGLAKVEYKREIIAILRMEIAGLPVEQIAKRIKQNNSRTARLLDSMREDGVVFETNVGRKRLWRVRGVGS